MSDRCANCPDEAQFHVNDPGANPLFYCRRCLPPHLNARAAAGDFALPEPPAPKPRRPKKPSAEQ